MNAAVFVCLMGIALMVVAVPVLSTEQNTVELNAQGCVHNGKHYDVGASFQETCTYCYCQLGQTNATCVEILCDWPLCPSDMEAKLMPGDCCPTCAPL